MFRIQPKTVKQLVETLSNDVRLFFKSIGVNEEIELRLDASGPRQQNVSVAYRGLIWSFQNEMGQELLWTNPNYPECVVGAHEIRDYFDPPTDAELDQRAKRAPWALPWPTIQEVAPYVRSHLPEILEILTTSSIEEVAASLQEVRMRLFAAQRRKGGWD